MVPLSRCWVALDNCDHGILAGGLVITLGEAACSWIKDLGRAVACLATFKEQDLREDRRVVCVIDRERLEGFEALWIDSLRNEEPARPQPVMRKRQQLHPLVRTNV